MLAKTEVLKDAPTRPISECAAPHVKPAFELAATAAWRKGPVQNPNKSRAKSNHLNLKPKPLKP